MKTLTNKVVALTGAGSGIGRELAIQLSNQGCHLALSDVNEGSLNETAKLLSSKTKVTTHIVDVAKREQVHHWADTAAHLHGQIDMIINNAGVASQGAIEDIEYEDFNWVFDVVFYGVLYGTKAI